MKKLLLLLMVLWSAYAPAQKFEQLAATPPMGWNTWNKFACEVNEQLIREAADALVRTGMRDAGYQYIVIDDCWHGERDSLGFIHEDPKRFPSGMKALADYIHSKGLKFGIYSDAGWKTCGGRPGSRGHEFQDARTYAGWGVDYLKYDWCSTEGLSARGAYLTMRDALYAAGRPIVFSLCEWGGNKPWEWGAPIGHLWRTTGDIYPCWNCEEDHGDWSSWGVLRILDMQDGLRQYAGPGHWNDPDMMEVGNGLTTAEDRAHFSLWCMLAAPLMAGNDIMNMTPTTHDILTNRDAIAIDQDALGIQGYKHTVRDGVEVWAKPLQHDAWAICFLNRGDQPAALTWDWKKEILTDDLSGRTLRCDSQPYQLFNVWTQRAQGNTQKVLHAQVPPHDVVMFRLTR